MGTEERHARALPVLKDEDYEEHEYKQAPDDSRPEATGAGVGERWLLRWISRRANETLRLSLYGFRSRLHSILFVHGLLWRYVAHDTPPPCIYPGSDEPATWPLSPPARLGGRSDRSAARPRL